MKKIFLLLIIAVFISACDKGGNTVTSPSGNSIIGAPTVTGITPTSGAPGATVTITGTDFSPTPANNTVFFNKTLATVKNATTTSLNVTVPAGATPGAVTVITAGGVATSPTNFTVSAGGTTGGSTGGGTGSTGSCGDDPTIIGTWKACESLGCTTMTFGSTCSFKQSQTSDGCVGTGTYSTSGGVATAYYTWMSSASCGTPPSSFSGNYTISADGNSMTFHAVDGTHIYQKQ